MNEPKQSFFERMEGDAFFRGKRQAAVAPESGTVIRQEVEERVRRVEKSPRRQKITKHLQKQLEFTEQHVPELLAEIRGIAEGFELGWHDLFLSLHFRVLEGLDGCSSWAAVHPEFGALVGKNRDFQGTHLELQRVWLHSDPAWKGRTILCVGSLGAPSAFSSGINSNGFCLVDTNIGTTDLGIGILRYFLMPHLLSRCDSVAEALEEIKCFKHAGGGSLILADAQGTLAAVELGHSSIAAEKSSPWIARTNHFLSPDLSIHQISSPEHLQESSQRLAFLKEQIASLFPVSLKKAQKILSTHSERANLCRHAEKESSGTISSGIYLCSRGSLYFAKGNPCQTSWSCFLTDLKSSP
ncbi:MAG: hypothetical protein HQM13_19770 [SAR324 cluster bacterium]|nr:hypothetical protein [SAR324 cluster bacterium]